MDMTVLRNIDNISRLTGNNSSINFDFQFSINHIVIFIVCQCPFEACMIQLHNARAHSRCFIQRYDIL